MKHVLLVVGACLLIAALPLAADHHEEMPAEGADAGMIAWQQAMTPGPQHEMLGEMVGEYKMTLKTWMSPDAPPMESTGTATRTMAAGGRVLVEEVDSMTMGQQFVGTAHTGYNNGTGTWWTTWFDNMSTGLTMMHGEHDAEAMTFTWTGESPNPMKPSEMAKMTVVSTYDESGKEVATFYMGEGDHKVRNMEIIYEPM